ncbi:hypothetical protein ACFOU0_12265 [Salinicoccus sesuvii]|uniref:Uncharacterized protein n=1 Tax=Salinicoccus sesuvii TaxID=868281 RepID=A0ABV7N9S3_9STAP
MSEYPYLEGAIQHYKHRFEKRSPIRGEAAEYNELKMTLRKAEAFDEMRKIHHEIDSDIYEKKLITPAKGYYTMAKELSAVLTGEIETESGGI